MDNNNLCRESKMEMLERRFEYFGFWMLDEGEGLYRLQNRSTGEFLEEVYNLEGLEDKLERLERN